MKKLNMYVRGPPAKPKFTHSWKIFFAIHTLKQVFSQNSHKPKFSGKQGNFWNNLGNLHKFGWKKKIHMFTQKTGQIHAFSQSKSLFPHSRNFFSIHAFTQPFSIFTHSRNQESPFTHWQSLGVLSLFVCEVNLF